MRFVSDVRVSGYELKTPDGYYERALERALRKMKTRDAAVVSRGESESEAEKRDRRPGGR